MKKLIMIMVLMSSVWAEKNSNLKYLTKKIYWPSGAYEGHNYYTLIDNLTVRSEYYDENGDRFSYTTYEYDTLGREKLVKNYFDKHGFQSQIIYHKVNNSVKKGLEYDSDGQLKEIIMVKYEKNKKISKYYDTSSNLIVGEIAYNDSDGRTTQIYHFNAENEVFKVMSYYYYNDNIIRYAHLRCKDGFLQRKYIYTYSD